jgi:hypothetical protein
MNMKQDFELAVVKNNHPYLAKCSKILAGYKEFQTETFLLMGIIEKLMCL